MIGQTVSHYRIVEELGRGGMGVVYKAEDTKLKRSVALKFLPPELTRDPQAKERFIHEAQAASALEHSNICNIHEIDETEDRQLFIVMACYEGEILKDKIQRGPLKLEEAIAIAIQIAKGLEKAHKKEIVHRDIKPGNIFITHDGVVKIVDFGLAKLKGQVKLTREGTTLGTAVYMSPEGSRGGEVDQRTDIWSLGIVLYEMLTGQLPFRGDYEQAVTYSILNEEPEPVTALRTGIPMELERIINKCLAKKPDRRYQVIEDVIVDLKEIKDKQDLKRKTVTQQIPPKKRNVPLIAAIAVICVVAVLAGVYFLTRQADVIDSIAVLPFQNLSADGPYAYFAGGLHDELLTQLSKVADFTVISRTSVMGYASTEKPLKQIADELRVRSIVEGSVQVDGERLRVNVQLIDAEKDAHIWAERYDRTLDDAFAIQSDVAQQIVLAVGVVLSNTERQGLNEIPTSNAEAYRLYLQGLDYFNRPGYLRQDVEIAQKLFERALVLDPEFALAHASLSQVHGRMFWFRMDTSPTRVELQFEEAETALRLAPDLPEAYSAMGLSHYQGHRNYTRALEEFTIALEKMPNSADIWARVGYVNRRLGNWEEVTEAFEKATQLDPRSATLFFDLGGNTYLELHRYEEAVQAYNKALSIAPDLYSAAIRKGWAYFRWQGQLDTLRTMLRNVPMDVDLGYIGLRDKVQADFLYMECRADSLLKLLRTTRVTVFEEQSIYLPVSLYTAWAHQIRGDNSAAQAAFGSALMVLDESLRELPDDYRVHTARGLALAGLGQKEEALCETDWLQQSEIYREDALDGTILAEDRAKIMAQIGETNSALDEIEKLLLKPSELSVNTLRLDPIWNPIRDSPRFQELIRKYETSQ
jgi:serine/threonine protein kinase/Tfp pilus assembly protein PilF